MSRDWEGHLDRWAAAGVLDTDQADRIRAWERSRPPAHRLSWPVVIALAFGAILLAAGVLLFVSAHWDELSPFGRMSLLVAAVGVFHAGGAVAARRFEALSIALHTVGSVALGAAILLAGQIFNLSEHWPAAVLLWAAGCAFAWLLLKHWTQGALCAVLVPWWLAGEWAARVPFLDSADARPIWVGLCALSFVYLGARRSPGDSPMRKALVWLGGFALLPVAFMTAASGTWRAGAESMDTRFAWVVALLVPLLLAAALNRRQAVWSLAAAAWTVVLAITSIGPPISILTYAWCAIGAAGLAAWGIRDARPERVNLAVAGLGLTVLGFYFSNVMDKLGRSASLIAFGLLFLGGGWLLEKARRRMLAHLSKEAL